MNFFFVAFVFGLLFLILIAGSVSFGAGLRPGPTRPECLIPPGAAVANAHVELN